MGACSRFQRLISSYIDGRLEGKRLYEMEAHLASCARCREEVYLWRQSDRMLSSYQPLLIPESQDMKDHVFEKIKQIQQLEGTSHRRAWVIRMGVGMAAAFLAGILISQLIFTRGPEDVSQGPDMQQVESAPEIDPEIVERLKGDLRPLHDFARRLRYIPPEDPLMARELLCDELELSRAHQRIAKLEQKINQLLQQKGELTRELARLEKWVHQMDRIVTQAREVVNLKGVTKIGRALHNLQTLGQLLEQEELARFMVGEPVGSGDMVMIVTEVGPKADDKELYKMASQYFYKGHYEAAQKYLEAILSKRPPSRFAGLANLMMIECAQRTGNYTDAVREAIKLATGEAKIRLGTLKSGRIKSTRVGSKIVYKLEKPTSELTPEELILTFDRVSRGRKSTIVGGRLTPKGEVYSIVTVGDPEFVSTCKRLEKKLPLSVSVEPISVGDNKAQPVHILIDIEKVLKGISKEETQQDVVSIFKIISRIERR